MKTLSTSLRLGIISALSVCAAGVSQATLIVDGTIFETFPGAVTSTVDHIPFTVNTAGTVTIDVLSWELTGTSGGTATDLNGDGEIAFIDSYMYLFSDDGSLDVGDQIAVNDDGPIGADGSLVGLDSYLSLGLAAGDYIIAIGAYPVTAANAVLGPNGGVGGASNRDYPSGGVPIGTVVSDRLYGHDHGDYRITITGDVSSVPTGGSTLAMFGLSLAGCAFLRRCSGR